MPRVEDKQLRSLFESAKSIGQTLYVNALTAQIRGEDPGDNWLAFEKMLTRVLILSNLIGRADAAQTMEKGGIDVHIPDETLESTEINRYVEPGQGLRVTAFIEAIREFVGKVPLVRSVVEQMAPAAQKRAFFVTQVESKTALIKIQERIGKALEATGTPTLAATLNDLRAAGAAELSSARLETVLRTNVMSALNEGQHEQMTGDSFVTATALWRLDEIKDRRTRGNPAGLYPEAGPHFQMDGFMEKPNHPVWQAIGWPGPGGFNCRRTVTPISWARARSMGLANEDNSIDEEALEAHNGNRWDFITSGQYPDEGFGGGAINAA